MRTVELVRLARGARAHASPYSSLTAAQWRPAGQGQQEPPRICTVPGGAVRVRGARTGHGGAMPPASHPRLRPTLDTACPPPLVYPLTYRAVRSALSR